MQEVATLCEIVMKSWNKFLNVSLMFLGHDTTASSITWALYELAKHPEIQSKIREELKEVLAGRDDNKIEW